MKTAADHLLKFPNARPSTVAFIERRNAVLAQLQRGGRGKALGSPQIHHSSIHILEALVTGPEKEAFEVLHPFLGEELAKAVIEFRSVTKKAKLTGYAAKLLLKEYTKTGDMRAAAEMQIFMSWQGFKASWYFNELAKTGQRHPNAPRRGADMADFTNDIMGAYYERVGVSSRHN